mgnify:CR=1 FL=1
MIFKEKKAFFFLVIIFCLGLKVEAQNAPPTPLPSLTSKFATIQTPEGFTIFAELAITPDQRTKGLMFRTRLAPNRGMLFTYSEPGYWIFWMKNTKMALDILWLNEKGDIISIQNTAPICTRKDNLCPRYRPTSPAVAVLELGAGRAKKLNLSVGKKLKIEMPLLPMDHNWKP